MKVELNKTKKITRVEAEIEVKRLHLPVQFKIACQNCNKDLHVDLNSDYLSYPILNKEEEMTAYCGDCNLETPYTITLGMTINVKQ